VPYNNCDECIWCRAWGILFDTDIIPWFQNLGGKVLVKYFKLAYNLEQYLINEWCKELRIKLKHGQGKPKLIDRVIERTPIVSNISLVGPIGSPFVLTILSVLLSCSSCSLHFLVASFPCFVIPHHFHNTCVRLL
jgi:hypothetical protein